MTMSSRLNEEDEAIDSAKESNKKCGSLARKVIFVAGVCAGLLFASNFCGVVVPMDEENNSNMREILSTDVARLRTEVAQDIQICKYATKHHPAGSHTQKKLFAKLANLHITMAGLYEGDPPMQAIHRDLARHCKQNST